MLGRSRTSGFGSWVAQGLADDPACSGHGTDPVVTDAVEGPLSVITASIDRQHVPTDDRAGRNLSIPSG